MASLVEQHLDVSQYVEGSGSDVWEVQAAAAELLPADERHSGPRTRWVVVLRAGGTPPVYDGRPTNADREVDWALEASLGHVLSMRQRDGVQLKMIVGTGPTANTRMLVFSRELTSWSKRAVVISPTWPASWVSAKMQEGALVVWVSYSGESWTVVMVDGEGDDVEPFERTMQRIVVAPAPIATEISTEARGERPVVCTLQHAHLSSQHFQLLPSQEFQRLPYLPHTLPRRLAPCYRTATASPPSPVGQHLSQLLRRACTSWYARDLLRRRYRQCFAATAR